jgi:hypothetical protein
MRNITDILISERFDGGDYTLLNNDLKIIEGFQNMPYIALFGGNVEQDTISERSSEQEFDFWGNRLFYPSNQSFWINSVTERTLNGIALNTSSRIEIEQQVKSDLEFMQQFSTIEVVVSLVAVDRVKIYIKIIRPELNEESEFRYIWDATKQELSDDDTNN